MQYTQRHELVSYNIHNEGAARELLALTGAPR